MINRKKLGFQLLSIFLGFSLALVLTEGAVRIYLTTTKTISDQDCRQEDKLLHHSLIPNSACRSKTKEWDIKFEVNSLGLRDNEYSEEKPENTFRILMLGDSFTEGYGIELDNTFSKLLENKLKLDNYDDGKKIEVINAGITGYSPILEYFYLKKHVLKLQPDLVILNYSMTDFYDDWKFKEKLLVEEGQVEKLVEEQQVWIEEKLFTEDIPQTTWIPFIPTSLKWWLHKNLASYDFIIVGLKKIFNPDVYKENLAEYKKGEISKDQFAITRDEISDEDYQKLMSNSENVLLKIREFLELNEIDFLLTIIPYGHQVDSQEWEEGRDYWQFEKNKIYSTECIEDLEYFAKENGIRVLNLLNVFQETKKDLSNLYYFPYDGHWSIKGHRLAAEEMFRFLVTKGS